MSRNTYLLSVSGKEGHCYTSGYDASVSHTSDFYSCLEFCRVLVNGAMRIRNIIGDNIRCYRNRLGWSQGILGDKCGISRDYIGRIERGEVNVGTDHLEKISAALNVETHHLLIEGECFQAINIDLGSEKTTHT